MVHQTKEKGLRRCRILSKNTPDYIVDWLCTEHNKHHRGSGQTVCGILHEALKIEAGWKKRCTAKGLVSRNPEYQKHYDAYVRETGSDSFASNINLFNESKSLAHTLESYDLLTEFEEEGRGVAVCCSRFH